MKRLTPILTLLLLAGCGGEEWVVIPEASAAEAVACTPLAGPEPPATSVETLAASSDSTVLLVDRAAREVVVLDRDATRIATLELTQDGPRGVALLTDAVPWQDTLLIVADAGRHRLRAFTRDGTVTWTRQLDFPPARLAPAGSRLLMTTVGMDGRLPALVYELRDSAAIPLEVPLTRHADAIARMFMNDVTILGYADGSALIANHFVHPRAWRIDNGNRPRELRVPVASGTEDAIGYLPPVPFREEEVGRIATPVIAAAADRTNGDLLYLSRTGRRIAGRSEKVLIRADTLLNFKGARRLDVNAVHVAYLATEPESAMVVDYEGGWFRCEAP